MQELQQQGAAQHAGYTGYPYGARIKPGNILQVFLPGTGCDSRHQAFDNQQQRYGCEQVLKHGLARLRNPAYCFRPPSEPK